MFWEKKEKERGLPDLPRPPSRPMIQSKDYGLAKEDIDDDEIHELPSFPDSPMHRGFSQSAIKDAVANDDVKEDQEVRMPAHNPYKVVEMEEWAPANKSQPRLVGKRENKPIFVRVDKFQLARNSLETVKFKLNEIEELLKTIRDVKAKEDTELSSWESDLENIKSRVQNVLNDIFERTEN